MRSLYAKYLSNSRKIAVFSVLLLFQTKKSYGEPIVWASIEQFSKPALVQRTASRSDQLLRNLLSNQSGIWNFERVMSVKRKLGVSQFRCRIAPGTVFANLRELNVADVQFSFEIAKAKTANRLRANIEAAKEPLGFFITTSEDPDYLMSFLKELWLVPAASESVFATEPRGQAFYLGPYWLKEFSLGEKVTLERHPGAIFNLVPWELEVLLLPTLNQIKAKLTKNELDRVLLFDHLAMAKEIKQWIAKENLSYQIKIAKSTLAEGLLFAKKTKLFEDYDLRQRLIQAIDRGALNQEVFDGFASYEEIVKEPPTRLPIKQRPLQVFTNQGSEIRAKLARLIIRDWQRIGVEAKLIRLPDAAFFESLRSESFQDIALVAFDEASYVPLMSKPYWVSLLNRPDFSLVRSNGKRAAFEWDLPKSFSIDCAVY